MYKYIRSIESSLLYNASSNKKKPNNSSSTASPVSSLFGITRKFRNSLITTIWSYIAICLVAARANARKNFLSSSGASFFQRKLLLLAVGTFFAAKCAYLDTQIRFFKKKEYFKYSREMRSRILDQSREANWKKNICNRFNREKIRGLANLVLMCGILYFDDL